MNFRSRKFFLPFVLLCIAAAAVLLLAGCEDKADQRVFTDTLETAEPNEDQHVTMTVTDDGYDVYAPLRYAAGYRYGPSIMYYPDGSIDAWFATIGAAEEWDWFTYKHSDDGGKTWSKEKAVLQPTPDSMDHYSVCDPGVIYFNGYYYLGYTSTIVSTNGGINNNVFVARSKNPDGPYEKWNGSGWGGDPQPIVYYDEKDSSWGAGEVSFVVVDKTLYCYYTWICPEGNFTKVATSDTSENWPANLEYQGFAYQKAGTQDSCDVVYIEDCGKFVAFSTYERFTENSGIAIFESNDGIHFTASDLIHTGVAQYCHNMGISKRPDGHVQLKDDLFIGYAYYDGAGDSWGKWPTRFQPIELKLYEGEVEFHDAEAKGTYNFNYYWEEPEERWPVAVSILPHVIEANIGDGYVTLEPMWYDTLMSPHKITSVSNLCFDNYDRDVIAIDGFLMKLKNVGKTDVTMHYGDLHVTFKVCVYPDGYDIGAETPAISSVRAVNDNMTVYIDEGGIQHGSQIRGYIVYEDGRWSEAYPGEAYPMEFDVADPSLIEVSHRGVITAMKTGTTTVTVTYEGFSFTVNVTVK